MDNLTEAKNNTCWRYSTELKQQILYGAPNPEPQWSRITLSHYINANVVHKAAPTAPCPECGSAGTHVRAGAVARAQLRAGLVHPHRVAQWRHQHDADLAGLCCRALYGLDVRADQVIRI